MMWVVAVGDPFHGITLYGPFTDELAACDWADAEFEGTEHTVVELCQVRDKVNEEDAERRRLYEKYGDERLR